MKLKHYSLFVSIKLFVSVLVIALFVAGSTTNAQPYHIDFSAHPPPATNDGSLDQNDHISPPFRPEDAIEVGVRFRVTQPGTVTGIRFFKGDGIGGSHIGHLWPNTDPSPGGPLAQATFTETANGWQEVAISYHITAGTNYIASVFSNVGDYAAEPLGSYNWNVNGSPPNDAPNDFGAPPVKVIRASNDPGGNGVYRYLFNATSPTGAYPNTDGGGVNFWIDISFQPDFSLPVSLTDFKATTAGTDVALSWKTEHEYYNKGFEIQRSNNGIEWYAVTFVNSAGESNTTKNYSFTDKSLAPGTYYYRLKQSDMDGRSTFSSIVSATITGKGKVSLFQNYPNPFSSSTTIRFDLPKAQHARLSVVDMMGREVKVLTDKRGEAGSHLITLDAATLSRQFYFVRLQTEDGVLTKKILVK